MMAASEIFSLEMSKTEALTQVHTSVSFIAFGQGTDPLRERPSLSLQP